MTRNWWLRSIARAFWGRSRPIRRSTFALTMQELETRVTPSGTGAEDHDHDHGPVIHYQPTTTYLTQPGQHLSGPSIGNPLQIAQNFVLAHASQLGLTAMDLNQFRVSDNYTDADSGTTHIYWRQQMNGLDLSNAYLNISVTKHGEVISVGSSFASGLVPNVMSPAITASEALTHAAEQLELTVSETTQTTVAASGLNQAQVLWNGSLSIDPIPAHLTWTATDQGARLTWDLVLNVPGGDHWYNLEVDAVTGNVLFLSDWVDYADYRVFALPNEHPLDGGRTLETDPHDLTYSPFGWHDTNGAAGAEFTDTRGNNVDAHTDLDANNVPDTGSRPDGGAGLVFDNPLDLTQAPSTYRPATVTNLFYWNNVLHDIHAHFGFTEVAGNFQEMNYSGQGAGSDSVNADAQDGSGTNNANFATPADGSNPRMQMFVWTPTSPDRDSDLDSGVIIHEYGHGVSNRLSGGPGNSNALNALQSGGMGEGWSDWWALMFTQRPTDLPGGRYPIGAYLLGQDNPLTAVGIRSFPYSFNMAVNPMTFADYGTGAGQSTAVHWTGARWASALWDLNWLLIQKHGYDADLYTGYNPNGTAAEKAGNKLAMKLINEGLKLHPANPTFIQARNAILSADVAITGGQNQYEIWQAFGRRRLGTQASTASSNSTSLVTSVNIPPGLINGVVTPVGGNENSSFTINGSFADSLPSFIGTDTNLTDTHTVTINWGDGSSNTVLNLGAGVLTYNANHTYADNRPGDLPYTVTITVADQTGASGKGTTTASVINVAPAPVITGAPTSSPEGQQINLSVSENDPGPNDAPFIYDWLVTKDGNFYDSGAAKNFSFTPDDNATYEVFATVTDKDGASGSAVSKTITVTNVAPQVSVSGPGSGVEGSNFIFTSNTIDVAGDLPTMNYVWVVTKNGVAFTSFIGQGTSAISFSDADVPATPDVFVIEVTATDKDGDSSNTASKTLTVSNAAPQVTLNGPTAGNEGSTFNYSAIASDVATDPISYFWSVKKNGVTFTDFTGQSTANVSFTVNDALAAPDSYVVLVTATDDDGASSVPVSKTLVVSNVTPTATFTNNGPVAQTDPVTIQFTNIVEPSIVDKGALLFSFDLNNDGDFVDVGDILNGSSASINLVYDVPGSYTIRGRIMDKDGAASQYTTTVQVDKLGNGGKVNTRFVAVGADVGGTSEVRVYDRFGALQRTIATGFTTGGVRVATGDINGDSTEDIIVGTGPGVASQVKVFSGVDGSLLNTYFPYPSSFKGGVYVASGDINRDFHDDVVIGPGAGSNLPVYVYSGRFSNLIETLRPFGNATHGITVAAGDMNGDGRADLVAGRATGGSSVRVMDAVTDANIWAFNAFTAGFTGGVTVAAGDINGDKRADLIVGMNAHAGFDSRARAIDGLLVGTANPASLWDFAVYPSFRGGVRVAVDDLDGDGQADILITPGKGALPPSRKAPPPMLGLKGTNLSKLLNFTPYTGFMGGVWVG